MLNQNRLEKVRRINGKTTAQCPACHEAGGDKQGNHLILTSDGKFGCVLFQGSEGHNHRQRIFELVGDREKTGWESSPTTHSNDRRQISPIGNPFVKSFGRLGRVNSRFTHERQEEIIPLHDIPLNGSGTPSETSEACSTIAIPLKDDSRLWQIRHLATGLCVIREPQGRWSCGDRESGTLYTHDEAERALMFYSLPPSMYVIAMIEAASRIT